MKKIISIILLSAILLTANIAFVQGSTLSNLKSNISQSRTDYRTKLAEIVPLQEQIRLNRAQILSLKAQANTAYSKSKSHIKDLIKNKDTLTPLQIESLKDALSVLQQDKEILGGTIGEIQKETLDLRTAKNEKNFEEVKNSMNNIISIQNSRINDLQKILNDLNKSLTV